MRFLAGLGVQPLAVALRSLAVETRQLFGSVEGGHDRARADALGLLRARVVNPQIEARLTLRVPKVGQVAAALAEGRIFGGFATVGPGAVQLLQAERRHGGGRGGQGWLRGLRPGGGQSQQQGQQECAGARGLQ
ncbi:MAG: hypothetical protein J0L58_15125 [Burkholderiales bacterium]|nr:hypothetical protein [Burkholderiales bacterium]